MEANTVPEPRTALPLAAVPRLAFLETPAGDRLELLRDRRIPGTRATIDQIAVAPSGVWIINEKDHVDDLERDVAAVRRALARSGHVEVPVYTAICLAEVGKQLGADGPLTGDEITELTRLLGAALPSAYPARARN